MRQLSFNQRLSQDAVTSDYIEIFLMLISHSSLDEPIRLSTDPTVRVSSEPLQYGTYSTWQTDDKSPFLFVLMSAQIPDDEEAAPATSSITLEAVDNRIAEQLNATTEQAVVDFAVVMNSSPDLVEFKCQGLTMVSSNGNPGEISISLSGDLLARESWPAGRMTRSRLPGLHR